MSDRVTLVRSMGRTERWDGLTPKARRKIRYGLRCRLARSWRERRACLALRLYGDGWTWGEVAEELGYTNGRTARMSALAHLITEMDT